MPFVGVWSLFEGRWLALDRWHSNPSLDYLGPLLVAERVSAKKEEGIVLPAGGVKNMDASTSTLQRSPL